MLSSVNSAPSHAWPTAPALNGVNDAGAVAAARRGPDPESQAWIDRLGSLSPDLSAAISDLHELLLNATRFEVDRRRWAVSDLRGRDREEFVLQLADSALANVLRSLGEYRAESRFTTWACKFAIREAATRMRRRSWNAHQIPPEPNLTAAVQDAIEAGLSAHERELLIAAALNHVPLDVLADRLSTSRGAVYATLQEARRKLRSALDESRAA
jgi:RNA polymerase sigma-70 factor (ECF subfamily)